MFLTIINASPDAATYTPLTTHQSATPASFATPVLHFRSEAARVVVAGDQLSLLPIFPDAGDLAARATATEQVEVDGIDVWVTSENLILYNPSNHTGVELAYPAITLHAIQHLPTQGPGIYFQISLSPASAAQTTNHEEFDDDELLELTVLSSSEDEVQSFFKALSECAALHPDEADSGDEREGGEEEEERGGEDDYRVGLGGVGGGGEIAFEGEWITAENAHLFRFDDSQDEGGREGGDPAVVLGPGAGTVREREGDSLEDVKWRRTE